MDENKEVKIPEIVKIEEQLQESQLRRLQLQDSVFTDLMLYLKSHIQMLAAKNELRQEIERILLEQIRDPDRPISMGYLIKLYEILSQEETAKSVGVLNVLQKSTNITINTPSQEPTHITSNTGDFSKEEMQQALDLLKTLKNLEKSEFSEKEIKE